MMAMCTYRSFENFQDRFGRRVGKDGLFNAEAICATRDEAG